MGKPPLHRPGAVLSLGEIAVYIANFAKYTNQHPELDFKVTRVGCGLANFKNWEIATEFARCNPENTYFDQQWLMYLPNHELTWGSA